MPPSRMLTWEGVVHRNMTGRCKRNCHIFHFQIGGINIYRYLLPSPPTQGDIYACIYMYRGHIWLPIEGRGVIQIVFPQSTGSHPRQSRLSGRIGISEHPIRCRRWAAESFGCCPTRGRRCRRLPLWAVLCIASHGTRLPIACVAHRRLVWLGPENAESGQGMVGVLSCGDARDTLERLPSRSVST
jgi:hypothetical protein